jgi:large subunit ribosomal protein L17
MFRNQLTALFTHERITTTVAKAKDLRPIAERMVTLARTESVANRRRIAQMIADNEVVQRLFENIAPRFSDRPGGYTRIVRLGRRRGDNAEMAIIEFVDYEPDFEDEGASKKGKSSLMDRAKGMFGGRGGEDEVEADTEELAEADEELEAAEEPAESEAVDEATEEPAEAVAEETSVEAAAEEQADEPKEPAAEEPEAEAEAEEAESEKPKDE